MTKNERKKLFKLRCQSKKGMALHPDDQEFVERMFKNYPDEYGKMDKEIYDATKPFGAS